MRNIIFLVMFLSFSSMNGMSENDESRLIRKLYLDTIGLLPTIEEMEWYMVYNNNGYDLAVLYVFNKIEKDLIIIPKEQLISILVLENLLTFQDVITK